MADYKVEVDLSELFDDMTISEQKSFLVDKFCSLPIDKMVEVVSVIVTPTGVSLKEALTKEVVKALNKEASIYKNYEIPEVNLLATLLAARKIAELEEC